MTTARIYLVGTADTKAPELAFIADLLRSRGAKVTLVDVGTRPAALDVDISADDVASHHPAGASHVLNLQDRGKAVTAMSEAFTGFIATRTDIAGVIGIGGGGGTSIITSGMRALPYGLPKLMVSTMASGDTAAYVGISDLIMMPSVTDLAGMNSLSRVILHNAAEAILGMASHPAPVGIDKPSVGLTMFGVTTACVTAITAQIGSTHDCKVFHATGTGGQTMEKLVESGLLSAAIDITTTEVADLLFDGVLPATPDRFGAFIRTGAPWVGSLGALDMVNFGAAETVPDRYKRRLLYRHNPQVTLMRTLPNEAEQIGVWIADRLNQCNGPVRLLIPEKGISALDAKGEPFYDPVADEHLFAAVECALKTCANRQIIRLPYHINDPEFAAATVAVFNELTNN